MLVSRLRQLFKMGDYRRFLLQALPANSVGCELGVWRGDFSEEILKLVKPEKLFLIDPWLYQPEYSNSWYGGGVAKNQQDMDDILDLVKTRLSDYSGVEMIRKKTDELSDEIPEESLDWVYVDGNHQYEFVLNDLRTFFAKVKPGGIICGDDYGRGKGAPITRAVKEFLEDGSCEMVWTKHHQYFLRKG